MIVYLITNLINGKQYIGAEKNGNNPNYFGSGRLIMEAIEKFGKENFKKEIIIDDKYIDSWGECLILESACILSFDTLRLNGYNISLWNWPLSFEILHRSGKKTKKLKKGFFAPGMASKGGKIAAKRTNKIIAEKRKENPEYDRKFRVIQSEKGRMGGIKQKELGIGMFAPEMRGAGIRRVNELYPKEKKEWGRRGAKRGHELYPKEHKEWSKRRAYILFEIDGIVQQITLGALFKT